MQITPGLRKSPRDPRTFKLTSVLGKVSLGNLEKTMELLPKEFIVADPKIRDQGNSDLCTAYVTTKASGIQENEELNPQWSFAVSKMISKNPEVWGQSLENAAKVHTKYGALAQKVYNRLDVLDDDIDLRYLKKWPKNFLSGAEKYQKLSYFEIDKNFRSFNGFKFVLFRNREHKRIIMTGVLWRADWSIAKDGIIPEEYGENGTPHAITFIGWVVKNGIQYLVAHLSNGENVGDKGKFYFSKSVVDREFKKSRYKSLLFIDVDPNYFKRKHWPFWVKVINFFVRIYGNLFSQNKK